MAKPLRQLVRDWRQSRTRMQKIMTDTPRIAGQEALAVVRDNFRLQGYDDGNSVQKWPARKESTEKRYDRRTGVKGSTFNSKNKILEQTGNLKQSIKYEVLGRNRVDIGLDLNIIPYGKIHNEALKGNAWGKHPFTMPLRKFMPTRSEGPNKKMLTRIWAKLDRMIQGAMTPFKK